MVSLIQKAFWELHWWVGWRSMQYVCPYNSLQGLSRLSQCSPLVRCEYAIWLERNQWIPSTAICAWILPRRLQIYVWDDDRICLEAIFPPWIRWRYSSRGIPTLPASLSISLNIFSWLRPVLRGNWRCAASFFPNYGDDIILGDLWGKRTNDIVIHHRNRKEFVGLLKKSIHWGSSNAEDVIRYPGYSGRAMCFYM